jgi:DNA-binding response OmpR family regulator
MTVHPKTILVVDDDEMVLSLLEANLRKTGFAVLTAVNGKDALAIVSRAPVDIIVSDISMPEMDGLEFCERIRRTPEFVDIPFIFLTAHRGEDERIRGLRSGADEYLVKPFSVNELITRVEILYDRIQRTRTVNTFAGNLRDVSFCEILQLFEMTRKQGVLSVKASTGKGTLSLANATLTNAAWNDLEGEDAVFEMFGLKEGSFRFQPKEVSPGNLAEPIGAVLMETARLTDELATLESRVPATAARLRQSRPFEGEDADGLSVSRAIAEGCTDAGAIQRRLRMSGVRARLAIAKLIDGGFISAESSSPGYPSPAPAEGAETKPTKLLIAFTDDGMLSRCLSLMGDAADLPVRRSGFSDFSQMRIASHLYDVVCLRGEKRFAFMWELVLKKSDGAIFVLKTGDDKEHAAFFSARAASLRKPAIRVSVGPSLRDHAGVRVVTTSGDMRQALSVLRSSAK